MSHWDLPSVIGLGVMFALSGISLGCVNLVSVLREIRDILKAKK